MNKSRWIKSLGVCVMALALVACGPAVNETDGPSVNETDTADDWPAMVDNPEYIAWSSAAVGDSVTYRAIPKQPAGVHPDQQVLVITMTLTLKSITEDTLVIATDSWVGTPGGRSSDISREFQALAKIPGPDDDEATEVEASRETITVPAGTFECAVEKTTVTSGNTTTVTTKWTSDTVPGGIVKQVSEIDGRESQTIELLSYDAE